MSSPRPADVGDDGERGDLPGWVRVMTAPLALAILIPLRTANVDAVVP